MANADIRALFDQQGKILPPQEWPDDSASLVTGYRGGTAKTPAKVTFESRADTMFKLIEEIKPLAIKTPVQNATVVNFDVDKMIEGMKRAQAITKGVTYDATPES